MNQINEHIAGERSPQASQAPQAPQALQTSQALQAPQTPETDQQTSANSTEELVCIVCPAGCRLTAKKTVTGADSSLEISGNFCPRGEEYARQELTNPMRVLTALMRIRGVERPVSVRTDKPVPKSMLLECASAIRRARPAAPVRRGDVLIRDLCGTGSNVIATRDA